MADLRFLTLLSKRLADWSPLGRSVVVAVSGGADSVALLRGLVALKSDATDFVVAHLNHGLRPQTAGRDEEFVLALANGLGLQSVASRIDLQAEALGRGESVETAARDCRYEFLQNTAESVGARFLALGHTADDQVETILHRIVRGTGLRGLAGMPSRRPLGADCELIRPLLDVRRSDVLAYLESIDQPYCHDETNDDSAHTRNRLRNDLLPLLQREYNSRVGEALLRLGRLSAEAQQALDAWAADRLEKAEVKQHETGCSLQTAALADCPAYVLRVALIRLWQVQGWGLREMGHDELDRVAAVIQNGAKPVTLPGNVDVRRRGDRVEFRRNAEPAAPAARATSHASA